MTPIFQPAAPAVSLDVLTQEIAILTAEGAYHVNGQYIASASDANTARRYEAERRVAWRARQAKLLSTCVWCGEAIDAADEPVEIGGRNLHPSCADEFDHDAYGKESWQ